MALSLKEFHQLKLLMARTTSPEDGEALTALRMANKILETHGLTWAKVFSRTVTVISELTGQPIPATGDEELDRLFQAALEGTGEGSFREMLLDIYSKHEAGVTLSPRQRQVVEDAAGRVADRHPGGRFR